MAKREIRFRIFKVVTFKGRYPIEAKVICNLGVVEHGIGETVKLAVKNAISNAKIIFDEKVQKMRRD